MSRRFVALLALPFFLSASAIAKDKNKAKLPDFILQARTVFVLVDPDAGIPLENPNGNRTARDEVEKALMRWGRFELTPSPSTADLIISVQKGSGRLVSPTIDGGPADNRPVIVQSTDSHARIGVQRGTPPGLDPSMGGPNAGPHPAGQIGSADDKFEVYQGGAYNVNGVSGASIWRYMAKNALNAPDVPAVGEFRKAIEEAEKQAEKRKKKQP